MRRFLILVWLAMPAWVLAKPTLAVAPIDGDKDGKVAELVVEAASEEYKVVEPDKVKDTMAKLDLEEIDGKAVKRLRKKLDAEIVVYGKVDKEGKKKTLTLSVSARGKRTSRFEIEYKSADAKSFKRELRAELGKRIETAERDDSNNDDEEEETKPRRDDEDDDEEKRRKKRRDRDDDDNGDDRASKKQKRHPVSHAALRIAAGGAAARRTLTYDTAGSMNPPPPVGTFGGAGRVDVELYPAAFDTLKGGAAGLGLTGEFEKSFGVGIPVPGTTVTSAIDQMRYSVGARYRIAFGTSSFAFGASYWHRRYVADRSKLATPATLDTPDVSYKAVAPTAVVRFAVGPTIGAYASLELPLMLSTGPIQATTQYGPASVIAFDLEAGAEILIGAKYGVRLAAQFEQVGLAFSQKDGTMAEVRGVASATDRLVGLSATLVVLY